MADGGGRGAEGGAVRVVLGGPFGVEPAAGGALA